MGRGRVLAYPPPSPNPSGIKNRSNTSLGLLSFTFVSDRSFKFLSFQIYPLSFEFVSDRSFKFLRFQIGPLSFEFVSNRSFLSTSVKPKLICPQSFEFATRLDSELIYKSLRDFFTIIRALMKRILM